MVDRFARLRHQSESLTKPPSRKPCFLWVPDLSKTVVQSIAPDKDSDRFLHPSIFSLLDYALDLCMLRKASQFYRIDPLLQLRTRLHRHLYRTRMDLEHRR